MTNFVNIPLENAFETTLENSISSTDVSVTLSDAPSFSLPGGQGVYAVIDPKNSYREVVLITAISGATLTVTRGQPDYSGGASTVQEHSGGATVVITNTYQVYSELATAVNSKLDANGGNATTTFDLDLSGSNFRIRKDGGSMKFTDDVQSEVSLSALAAAAGTDEKSKVSAADTTTGYLNTKITVSSGSGATVTKSITSPAGDERLNIDVALNPTTASIAEHLIYTPAYLTGGNSAESAFNNWLAVLDGSFAITINGTLRNVTGINFTGVTSMEDVATKIQTAIRALTTSTETVVWSTDHFVISSILTTSSSAITVTSAAGAGTDISGAGASNWMDCNVGSGVVTAAVLNRAADASKLVRLDTNGQIETDLMQAEMREAETFFAATNITGAEAETLTAGTASMADTLHAHQVQYDIDNSVMGTGLLSTVKNLNFQIPFAQITLGNGVSTVVLWTSSGSIDYEAYNYLTLSTTAPNQSYISTLAIAPAPTGINPFQFSDTYTKLTTEFKAIFDATYLANGNTGFGFCSTTAPLINYDDATVMGLNFSIADDASGKLYAHAANAGGGAAHTETEITDIILTNLNTFRIEYTKGVDAKFYVNGVLKATLTTNLPTAGADVRFGIGINEGGGGTSKCIVTAPFFSIDY
jgi:hypothetical protein